MKDRSRPRKRWSVPTKVENFFCCRIHVTKKEFTEVQELMVNHSSHIFGEEEKIKGAKEKKKKRKKKGKSKREKKREKEKKKIKKMKEGGKWRRRKEKG